MKKKTIKGISLVKSSFFEEEKTKKKLSEFIAKSAKFSMGEETKKFEEAFAKKQERKYAVFVNSGSSANLILLQALLNLGRIKPGSRVGISALTWGTNVMPVIQLGLTPVAIDVEKDTLNISPETLKRHLGEIETLFLTNVLGFSDDISSISRLCKKEGILLIEDNCEALGSRVGKKLLGNFGLASTFSFFVAHHISTIEGGMVATDDEELYHMLVMVRAHGWDRNLTDSKKAHLKERHGIDDFFSKYSFYDLAYNVRPTDIQGFIGNLQLPYWDTIVKRREKNFHRFHGAIKENSDLSPFALGHMDIVSNFAVPIIAKTKKIFDRYKKIFEESRIEIRPIIAGDITKQPFYRKHVKKIKNRKNAGDIHLQGFYFGNHPEYTEEEIGLLLSLLKQK